MKEIFSFGHIHIYFFGITIAIGMLAAILLILKETKRTGLPDPLFDVVLFALLGGILGARLAYILFYDPAYYIANPLEIIRINAGGLSIHGGILGGVLLGLWRVKKFRLPLWQIADLLVPALILGQAIGRIGCDVFGIPMAKPYFWGINVNSALVHPTQAYEFILDYLFFAYLWARRLSAHYQGQIFVHYLIGYSLIRAFVEVFRTNPTVFGFLSVAYLLSLAGVVVGIILHQYLKKRYPLDHQTRNPYFFIYPLLVSILLIIASTVVYYYVQG